MPTESRANQNNAPTLGLDSTGSRISNLLNLVLMCGNSAGSPGYHLHRWQHGRLAGHRLLHQRGCGQAGGWAGSREQDRHQEYLREPGWQTLGVWGSQRDAEVGKGGVECPLTLPGKKPRGCCAWNCVTVPLQDSHPWQPGGDPEGGSPRRRDPLCGVQQAWNWWVSLSFGLVATVMHFLFSVSSKWQLLLDL